MEYLYTMFSLDDIGNMFNLLLVPFQLLVDFISTIANAIYGLITILVSIIYLAFTICALLPSPLYETFMTFVYVYIAIYTFKLVKGII